MNYELVFILKPDVSEEELKVQREKVKELIAKSKGEIVKEEVWGKRAFAYPIKHFTEGQYGLFYLKSPASQIKDLEKKLTLDDEILRFLIIRREVGF